MMFSMVGVATFRCFPKRRWEPDSSTHLPIDICDRSWRALIPLYQGYSSSLQRGFFPAHRRPYTAIPAPTSPGSPGQQRQPPVPDRGLQDMSHGGSNPFHIKLKFSWLTRSGRRLKRSTPDGRWLQYCLNWFSAHCHRGQIGERPFLVSRPTPPSGSPAGRNRILFLIPKMRT